MQLKTSGGTKIFVEGNPKKGLEGEVYKIDSPSNYNNKCIKLYLEKYRNREREEKILYMVQNRPSKVEGDGYIICWPQELIYQDGLFSGFVMHRAPDSIELSRLCLDKLNRTLSDEWHTKYDMYKQNGKLSRLKMCVNIAYAINNIHSMGIHTMVDMKPKNILITHKGGVFLVDMDSIQIGGENKVQHHASALTPEYAPPERNYLNLKLDYIPLSWDRFSIAVMFYQILLGIHPYTATFGSPYDNNDTIEMSITKGLFVHGSKAALITALPPLHNGFKSFPQELRDLFVRSFEDGNSAPQKRPSIDEWGTVLCKWITEITNQQSKTHGIRPTSIRASVVKTTPIAPGTPKNVIIPVVPNIPGHKRRNKFIAAGVGISVVIFTIVSIIVSNVERKNDKHSKCFSVTIDSSPSGATAFIDKKQVGITPLSITLEKGSHGIYFKKEGYTFPGKILEVGKDVNPFIYKLEEE